MTDAKLFEKDLSWKVLLAPTFRNGSLLCSQNLAILGKLLKVSIGSRYCVIKVMARLTSPFDTI
jgi:hypothetical protein